MITLEVGYRNEYISDAHRNALKIAAKGKPVFPCNADKSPCTPRGFKDASADPARVTALWNSYGGEKVGMPTGEHSDVFVVDVDRLEALGELPDELPETLTVRTPSGGLHFYYRHVTGITNRRGTLPPGIDVRGDGGYVIAPPSEGYAVERRAQIADAPDWLIEALREQTRNRCGFALPGLEPMAVPDDGGPIPDGQRNQALARIAGRLHDGTRDHGQLEDDLLAVNDRRCVPPLPPSEVRKISGSIHRREPCRPGRREPDPEVLELVEALERWWWGEAFPGIGGKTMASFLRMLLREGKRVGTVIPGVGLRVSLSVRAAAEMVGCHRNTIENMTKRARVAGILRKDGAGPGLAAAFVLLDPAQGCDTRTTKPTVVGVSQVCAPPVAGLRTPHYRWRGLVGKGKERTLCGLEAFGGQTAEKLAERLGFSRARDLVARHLKPLEALGLVEESGGVWSLAGEVAGDARDVPYSTVQSRVKRAWSPTEGRWVHVAAESGIVASEVERERLDRERHERERQAFQERRQRAADGLSLHPANGNADGFIEDLEPADAPEPELSPLAAAMRDYLDRNANDVEQPPGWLGLTLWAYDLCDDKPTPEESRAALEELRAHRRGNAEASLVGTLNRKGAAA